MIKQKTIMVSIGIFVILTILNLVSAVSIVDVSSSPEEVAPGQIVEISIEIENVFDYDVTNLNIRLDLIESSFAPYQSSSEKFIDKLKDGDEEIFKFKLITLPETSTGIYTIPVEIRYEYKNENSTLNSSTKDELISITVNSPPELKVSTIDSILVRGKENDFSIKIINSGLADVKFVYLTVNDVNGIKFLSEKEQYIGDINSDDFDSIEYRVYVDKDASETIT